MKRSPTLRTVAWLSAAAGAAGCDHAPLSGPAGPPKFAFEVLASDPRAVLGGVQSVGSPQSSLVHVALRPGAVPHGASAEIRNRAAEFRLALPLVDGGFDPVAVPAVTGDTIEVVAADSSGAVSIGVAIVAERRRPVVVRTDPPPRKVDVPLNAVIIVVFSEPIEPGSVTNATIALTQAGSPVRGVHGLSSDGLRVDLRPDTPLAPETEYQLSVTTGVTDRDGDALEEPVDVTFTTGRPIVVASVTVSPDTGSVEVSGNLQLTAVARDSAGQVKIGLQVAWSSSNPAVASVTGTGVVKTRAPGAVVIEATIQGVAGSASITVVGLAFTTVTAGGSHTCGLTVRESIACWGANAAGQIGVGDTLARLTPSVVAGALQFRSVDAGAAHTCGLAPASHCWGRSAGSVPSGSDVPTVMPDSFWLVGSEATPLSAGFRRTCGISTDGATYCWGAFQISGGEWMDIPWPIPIPPWGGSAPGLTTVTAGGWHMCGLTAAGAGYCWGANSYGELGDGTRIRSISIVRDSFRIAVVPVLTPLAFTSLTAGFAHTCGLTPGGPAYCWGDNVVGQLGSPIIFEAACDNYPCNTMPVAVATGIAFESITAGDRHTCAIASGGAAYCWGDNSSGQLGDGTTTSRSTPLPVSGELSFATLSAGGAHTCGLTTDGEVYCWGANSDGQLGDGTTTSRMAPVRVGGRF